MPFWPPSSMLSMLRTFLSPPPCCSQMGKRGTKRTGKLHADVEEKGPMRAPLANSSLDLTQLRSFSSASPVLLSVRKMKSLWSVRSSIRELIVASGGLSRAVCPGA